MPAMYIYENILVLDMIGGRAVLDWSDVLKAILRKAGIEFKILPVQNLGNKWRIVYYINLSGPNGERAWHIIKSLLSTGYMFRNKLYKWPSDVKVKIRVEKRENKVVSLKRLVPQPRKPKEAIISHGYRAVTVIAHSANINVLRKFISALASDLNKEVCPVSNIKILECEGGGEYTERRSIYEFDTSFVLKPGAKATLYIFLPASKKGFVHAKQPFILRYEYLIDKYKNLLRAIKIYPKIKEYAEKGITIQKLKRIDPEAFRILEENNAVIDYEKYVVDYKAFSKETLLHIVVYPEMPKKVVGASVSIYVDGKQILEETASGRMGVFKVPVSTTVYWLKIRDENGNPIVHTVKVVSNEYFVKEKSEGKVYYGILWASVNKQCLEYLNLVHSKNPGKIMIQNGRIMPELKKCKELSP